MAKKTAQISQVDAAARAGVSVPTLRSHLAEGAPALGGRSTREVAAWLAKYRTWRRAHGKTGPAKPSTEDDGTIAFWSREKQKWQALRAKVEHEVRMGQLVPVAEVEAFAAAAVMAVRQRMEEAKRRLPPAITSDPVQLVHVEQLVRAEFDEICDLFAKSMEPRPK